MFWLMEPKAIKQRNPSWWATFLDWLDGKESGDERLRMDLPKRSGDTLHISKSQREKLDAAVTGPADSRQTSYYSRDTESRHRSKSSSSSGGDGLII